MNFEDGIPYYPVDTDPEYQFDLYKLEEFYELQAKSEDDISTVDGGYFKDQMFSARVMKEKDKCFFIKDTSSGKTCNFVAIAETMKESPSYDMCYYVTSDSIIASAKFQILCKCTNKKYMTDKIINSKDITERNRNITYALREWYKILNYNDLASMARGKRSTEIEKIFSGTLINIDEAHNLIPYQEKETGKYNTFLKLTEKLNMEDIDDDEIINSKEHYIQIWRIFHLAKRCKLFLSTATFIKNQTREAFILCNLLLNEKNQIPFNFNYERANLKSYFPFFNGLFSYIRAPETGAYPEYIGDRMKNEAGKLITYDILVPKDEYVDIDVNDDSQYYNLKIESQTVVYNCPMIGIQAETYYDNIIRGGPSGYRSAENAISQFVDSRGKYKKDEINYSIDDISNPDYQYSHCSKYAEIITIEKDRLQKDSKPGCAYVNNQLVEGGGIKALVRMFEDVGFEIFDLNTTSRNLNRDPCRETPANLPKTKKPRIVFIDGSTEMSKREEFVNILSSPENIDGEYIQVLVGSDVTTEGINMGNIVREYNVSSRFHEAGMYQTRSRVFRTTAHKALRERLAREQGVNVSDVKIPVEIYNMVASSKYYFIDNDTYDKLSSSTRKYIDRISIPELSTKRIRYTLYSSSSEKGWKDVNAITILEADEEVTEDNFKDLRYYFNKNGYENNISYRRIKEDLRKSYNVYIINTPELEEYMEAYLILPDDMLVKIKYISHSSDLDNYKLSESKNIQPARVKRYAKQYAIDCLVNFLRNIKKYDKDYSIECDYQKCRYTCFTRPENKEPIVLSKDQRDWKNYKLLYSSGKISDCKDKIIDLVKEKGKITLQECFLHLDEFFDRYFIYSAIYKIISERNIIYDRYGFKNYVMYNKAELYLSNLFPYNLYIDSNIIDTSFYYNKCIAVKSDTSYPKEIVEEVDDKIDIIENTTDDYDIYSTLLTMKYSSIRTLIERVLIRFKLQKEKGKPLLYCDITIRDLYKRFIYNVKYKDNIYLTHIFPEFKNSTSYNIVIKFRKVSDTIRVLYYKNGEYSWRDSTGEEADFFRKNISEQILNDEMRFIEKVIEKGSRHYLTYYEDNYRIADVDKIKNNGINITSETDNTLRQYIRDDNLLEPGERIPQGNIKNIYLRLMKENGEIYAISPILEFEEEVK